MGDPKRPHQAVVSEPSEPWRPEELAAPAAKPQARGRPPPWIPLDGEQDRSIGLGDGSKPMMNRRLTVRDIFSQFLNSQRVP